MRIVSPSVGPQPAGQSRSGTVILPWAAAGVAASPAANAKTPPITTELNSCFSIPSSSPLVRPSPGILHEAARELPRRLAQVGQEAFDARESQPCFRRGYRQTGADVPVFRSL